MVLCSSSASNSLVSVAAEDKENASHALPSPHALVATSRSRRRPRSPADSSGRTSPSDPPRRRRRPPPPTASSDMFSPAPAAPAPAAAAPSAPDPGSVTIDTPSAKIIFPRALARPAFKPISPAALSAIDPALDGVAPRYVADRLRPLGPALMAVLAAARGAPATGLPAAVDVRVRARPAARPTHMLAVHSKNHRGPAGAGDSPQKRPVTLFPAHDLVLAVHCANLPPFPPPPPGHASLVVPDSDDELAAADSDDAADVPAETLSLPIVPLCIPSPPTFPLLQTYLYTQRADQLLARLLPALPPDLPAPRTSPAASPRSLAPLVRALRAAYAAPVLLQHTLTVHGLWSNVCVLGVFDERLWKVLDVAWEVLVGAMDGTIKPEPAADDADAPMPDAAPLPALPKQVTMAPEPVRTLPADTMAPAEANTMGAGALRDRDGGTMAPGTMALADPAPC